MLGCAGLVRGYKGKDKMKDTMKGAFMCGLDNMIIKEIDKPTVSEGEAVVSLEYIGICGSDVHYYHNGRVGAYEVDLNEDYMLGHETAGTVVETGPGVENLKVGDRVCLEPGVPCGKCEYCKSGKYNLCPDVRFLATPPIPGAMKNSWPIQRSIVLRFRTMCQPWKGR